MHISINGYAQLRWKIWGRKDFEIFKYKDVGMEETDDNSGRFVSWEREHKALSKRPSVLYMR